MQRYLERIPARYWGLAGLCLLSLAYLALCRYDLYGIDEGAARGLLLDWSIASQILSPVAVLGFPDMRALVFAPLVIHWTGDLLAAKMLTIYLTLAAALMLYRWAEANLDEETALFATGLWLISPLTVSQIDSLGGGNYLVLAALLSHWLDARFRATKQTVSTYYFLLLLLAAFAASVHPAGLGMALGLAWTWFRDDGGQARKRLALFIGMGLMVAFVLISRLGWPELPLFTDPLPALAAILAGDLFDHGASGLAVAAFVLLVAALILGLRRRQKDLFTTMLMAGIILGLAAADRAWAQLALVLILFHGLHALVVFNSRVSGGLVARRGVVGLSVVVLCTMFMLLDKQRFLFVQAGRLHATDAVIAELVEITAKKKEDFLTASQWPGRTMLATRRGALPLPPPREDPDAFLLQMRGIDYMVFDPYDRRNKALGRIVAALSNRIKTVRILPGGVILRLPPQAHRQHADRKH